MKKRFFSLMLIMAIVGNLVLPIMASEIKLSTTPEIINKTAYLPVKEVAKQLNAKVEWAQASRGIVIIKGFERMELSESEYVIGASGEALISFDTIVAKFNVEATYNEGDKGVRLVHLVPPTAKFEIPTGTYMAGSNISITNTSHSPNGEPIVDSIWEVNGNQISKQTNDINKVVKSLKDGTYTIRLKVKNSKKVWSEWTEQKIVVSPRPKPAITSFAAIKLEWAQGEMVSYTYNTEVEPGIEIIETRWTYQKEGEPNPTEGNADVFFDEGTYTITLEVKDQYDVWSNPAITKIHITDKVEKTELRFKLENIRHGDTFENSKKYNFQQYDPVENFEVTREGPTLLFSNSPETVLSKGILYSDKVVGDTRVLYHHRNGMKNSSSNTRLVIVVENKGNEPVTITQTKKSNAGPSQDILHLGQIVTRRYFNSNLNDKITLKPNEKRYLYDTGKTAWPDYESFSGVIDFNTNKTVTVTVAAVDRDFHLSNLETLPVAPRDGIHTRGTFPKANKRYTVFIPGDKPTKLMLGQKEDQMDSWLEGYDALTGAKEVNKGNYGVMYELELYPETKTGVLLNPRGTSFKGSYRWEGSQVALAPVHGMFIGSQRSSITGVVNSRELKRLYYTISNGSSGPVLFNFIPEEFWNDYQVEKDE